ncbi:MAG: hypothetical protein ACYS47_09955, partial [Planctomycetota bacterium]
MKRPIMLVTLLWFGCSSRAMESALAGEKKEYPTTKEGWEAVIRSLDLPNRKTPVSTYIPKIRNPAFESDDGGMGNSRWIWSLDDNWYFHFHVTGRGSERKETFEVVGFDDFREKFGDRFEHVERIHKSPSILGIDYSPAALMRTVNHLHSLGKEDALAALKDYYFLSRRMDEASFIRRFVYRLEDKKVFLILRLLFRRKDGDPQMPEPVFGDPGIRISKNEHFPIFPLVLQDGIPFLLIHGYEGVGGHDQDIMEHIRFCEEKCVLIDEPLAPEGSAIDALEKLFASDRYQLIGGRGANETYRNMLKKQAIYAYRPTYHVLINR